MQDTTEILAPSAPPSPQSAPSANPLFERAILLNVSFSRLGTTKKVRGARIDKDADTDVYSVNKKLFRCVEYDAIRSFDGEIKTYLDSKCLPSTVKGGIYFLPIASIEEVDLKLTQFAARREQLVAAFVEIYPTLLLQAEMRLRAIFDERDYPHQNRVSEHFSLSWQTLSMGVPDVLETISTAMFERERAKAAQQWEAAQEQIQALLRVRLKGMVDHLTERLTPDKDGKCKVFKNSLVGNIESFLSDFSALNITNDRELETLADQARELLSGVDAATLRQSENTREVTRVAFESISHSLETMLTDKPKRAFSFEDI